MTASGNDSRLAKMRYRCWRRGFREADLILGPFSDARAKSMSVVELDNFEALLEVPDQDLYDWIKGAAAPEWAEQNPILEQLRDYAKKFAKIKNIT